jgi:hypothetical protein
LVADTTGLLAIQTESSKETALGTFLAIPSPENRVETHLCDESVGKKCTILFPSMGEGYDVIRAAAKHKGIQVVLFDVLSASVRSGKERYAVERFLIMAPQEIL